MKPRLRGSLDVGSLPGFMHFLCATIVIYFYIEIIKSTVTDVAVLISLSTVLQQDSEMNQQDSQMDSSMFTIPTCDILDMEKNIFV